MRWEDRGRSRNLEDRRGRPGGRGAALGGSLGIGGFLLLLVLSMVFGVDLFSLLGGGPAVVPTPQGGVSTPAPVQDPAEEELVRFVSFVLDDIQANWTEIFRESGIAYRDATLVLYRQGVDSACGSAPSAVGPFYCPLDEKVYLDLEFFETLQRRLDAPGDFAQAYVLAHELGHHVQQLLGTAEEVRRLQQQSPGRANALSVAMELQADCYAGVWGASAQGRELLQPGDVDEGLRAAASVGDDALRGRAGGRVNPESFTHGSAEQRARWFLDGLRSGDPAACDTFAAL